MPRIIGIFLLVFSVVLFPPAALAFVSQNAIPGDATYPIKRKLEDGILLAASLNPKTKAWFSTDLANTRFAETQALIAQNKSVSVSLQELVAQTNTAALDINEFQDPSQKAQYVQTLTTSINKYEQVLAQVQQQQPETSLPNPQPAVSATVVPEQTQMSPSPTQVSTTTPSSAPTQMPQVIVLPQNQIPAAPLQSQQQGTEYQQIEQARQQLEQIKSSLDETQHFGRGQDSRDNNTGKRGN